MADPLGSEEPGRSCSFIFGVFSAILAPTPVAAPHCDYLRVPTQREDSHPAAPGGFVPARAVLHLEKRPRGTPCRAYVVVRDSRCRRPGRSQVGVNAGTRAPEAAPRCAA